MIWMLNAFGDGQMLLGSIDAALSLYLWLMGMDAKQKENKERSES